MSKVGYFTMLLFINTVDSVESRNKVTSNIFSSSEKWQYLFYFTVQFTTICYICHTSHEASKEPDRNGISK